MIELREEPYDGPVAVALVRALLLDIRVRYAPELAAVLAPEDTVPEELEYLGEVQPAEVTRPAGAFLVARVGGEAVGCGAVRPLPGLPGVGEVKRMYTAPAARRLGVGRVVLARLEAIAGELGYQRLQLETGSPQPEAVALYAAAGWERIVPYGRYRDEPTSVCFAKDLPG